VVVLYAHPAHQRSRINRALYTAIADLPGVALRDLYELYPDFDIDVRAEQALLRPARLLVLQHPVYWYSTPSLLKEWIDTVLTRGFAYGPGGVALRGKDFRLVLSTGALPPAYSAQGPHGHPIAELLLPLQQTARFCGMRCLPPLLIQGGRSIKDAELQQHVAHYREFLLTYQQRSA